MRDNLPRRAIKALSRGLFTAQLRVNRAFATHALSSPPRYRLMGSCEGCGQCCEAPSIAVGRSIAHLTLLRMLFVWWQSFINGFELQRFERTHRIFVFSCTHYDPVTKQCDSYESRPGICRDYPISVLDQDAPLLFPECTYSLELIGADSLRDAIDEDPTLSPEQREALKRKLLL